MSEKEALKEISMAFQKTKTIDKSTAKDLAKALLSQVNGMINLYQIAENQNEKNKDLKKSKAKGASFKALEAATQLQEHNLKNVNGHNIEMLMEAEANDKFGFSFGLNEILWWLNGFNERANSTAQPPLQKIEYALAYQIANFYLQNTKDLPKPSKDSAASIKPYRAICENIASHIGLKIGYTTMKNACDELERSHSQKIKVK